MTPSGRIRRWDHAAIAADIERRITEGMYGAGRRLPSEQAQTVGSAATPPREARLLGIGLGDEVLRTTGARSLDGRTVKRSTAVPSSVSERTDRVPGRPCPAGVTSTAGRQYPV